MPPRVTITIIVIVISPLTLKLGDVLLPLLVTGQRYHQPAAAAPALSDVVVAMPHPVAAKLCATAGDAAAWPPKCMQTQFSTANNKILCSRLRAQQQQQVQ